MKPKLSIVLAVEGAHENLPSILANLGAPAGRPVETIVCHAANDELTPQSLDRSRVDQLVASRPRSRIPHLWRDGIVAASGEWVATLSAHCIPDARWLERARELIVIHAQSVAVGGSIALDEGAKSRDRAMHVLRYLRYTPPVTATAQFEPAADNALYRRAAILEEADLLADGFWEPSFHARFRRKGGAMHFDQELRVVHSNRYSARAFCAQRFDHGRAFGRARAVGRGLPVRLALLLAAPVLPAAFFAKLSLAALRHPFGRRALFTALPWLLLYLAAWGAGEARGYADALTKS